MSTVNVVMQKADDELRLFGVFETRDKAVKAIEGFTDCKSQLILYDEQIDLIRNLDSEQEWDTVFIPTTNPDVDDVWGYLITDRVQ